MADFIHWVGNEGRYFWRVRTLDGVNNWSPWSAVRTVRLGDPQYQRLSHVRLAVPETVGGATVQGAVVIQDRVAPAGGVTLNLRSSNPAVARVPATVTVPAGSDRATFAVTTTGVAASTPVLIRADDTALPDTTVLWVDPGAAPAPAPSAVSLSPSTVAGGGSSIGTVTLTAAAPTGGLVVTLASSNTAAATVPASVTVPAGSTSATFTVTTRTVTANTPVTISAAAAGVTRSATLTVNRAQADTVSVSRAEYRTSSRELRIEATSTSTAATLTAYVTSTQQVIGTLRDEGGGRYRGQFTWPNPQNVTLRSSLGGTASRAVTVTG